MSLTSPQDLMLMGSFIVARTDRGNGIINRDPRQMPRRLRVLLLAIDGGQPVSLYTQTLKGFGDVSVLLSELINLGLVKLTEPEIAKQQRLAGRKESFAALDQMLDDSRFDSQAAADMLYGSTMPGSFDAMVRVARADHPEFAPPPTPAPAPVPSELQKAQLESLFNLLDAVRGERKQLKHNIQKLQRVKEAALRLHSENQILRDRLFGLGILCAMLVTGLVIMVLRS